MITEPRAGEDAVMWSADVSIGAGEAIRLIRYESMRIVFCVTQADSDGEYATNEIEIPYHALDQTADMFTRLSLDLPPNATVRLG